MTTKTLLVEFVIDDIFVFEILQNGLLAKEVFLNLVI